MPWSRNQSRGAAGERGHGGGALIVVQLAVGEPGAVVDDRVAVLPAHAPRALGAVAGDGVPGLGELAELLDVHVQQVARARPLVADDRRALRRRPARAAAAPEHLMDGRMRPGDLGLVGEPARAPAGAFPQLADPCGLVDRHLGRRAPRPAGALGQAGPRRALSRGGLTPATHPLPDRRLRDVRPGRGPGERLAFLGDTTHDFPASQRCVAGSMVRHLRASSRA